MSGHPTPLAPGDNTPRIMRATGAVSHTGPSGQHPHHRGHEEGNGASSVASSLPGSASRGGGPTISEPCFAADRENWLPHKANFEKFYEYTQGSQASQS